VLTTARLTLGPFTLADYEDSRALWQDPQVVRYIGGQPATEQECWTRLLRQVGHWSLMGFGFWCVRETASGRFVGEIGLAEFHRDITPSLVGAPEAGWVLATWSHGKGFGAEAGAAVFAWADLVLAAERTVCIIDPGNAASLGVAAKMGFKRFAETTFWGEPAVLLERFAAAGRGVSV
jgi:RimJ/RimL family protein N-acetyltransferase